MSAGPGDDRLGRIEDMLEQLLELFGSMGGEGREQEADVTPGRLDGYAVGDTSQEANSLDDYTQKRIFAAQSDVAATPYVRPDNFERGEIISIIDRGELGIEPEDFERYHFYAITFFMTYDSLTSVFHSLSETEFTKFIREVFILSPAFDDEEKLVAQDLVRTVRPSAGFFGIGYDERSDKVAVRTPSLKMMFLESHQDYWFSATPVGLENGPFALSPDEYNREIGLPIAWNTPTIRMGLEETERERLHYGSQEVLDTIEGLYSIAEDRGLVDDLDQDTVEWMEAWRDFDDIV